MSKQKPDNIQSPNMQDLFCSYDTFIKHCYELFLSQGLNIILLRFYKLKQTYVFVIVTFKLTHQNPLDPTKLDHSFGVSWFFCSRLLSRGHLITIGKTILKWLLKKQDNKENIIFTINTKTIGKNLLHRNRITFCLQERWPLVLVPLCDSLALALCLCSIFKFKSSLITTLQCATISTWV